MLIEWKIKIIEKTLKKNAFIGTHTYTLLDRYFIFESEIFTYINLNPQLNGVEADVTKIDKIKKKPNRQALSETSKIRGCIISSSVHNTRPQHCALRA